jgi:ABC-type phosphate transport system auxiliary subunit
MAEGDTASTAATGLETAGGQAVDQAGHTASDVQARAEALKRLRTRLDELEAENSELQAQLEAERKRRRQLETEDDDQRLFSVLRSERCRILRRIRTLHIWLRHLPQFPDDK